LAADAYKNFGDLIVHEIEGKDFSVLECPRSPTVAIIAPHGGKIECGTSTIATAIAAEDYSLYIFEGLKAGTNRTLHITSTNFDEPRCLKLIGSCDVVVAIHGLKGTEQRVDVGGKDRALRDSIANSLKNADFTSAVVTSGNHAAISTMNICNRGRSGAGVQLEITRALRNALRSDATRLGKFAEAVRGALKGHISN